MRIIDNNSCLDKPMIPVLILCMYLADLIKNISTYHCKKATIYQVTTMLATSENVLFPGRNHLPTTAADDLKIGHF